MLKLLRNNLAVLINGLEGHLGYSSSIRTAREMVLTGFSASQTPVTQEKAFFCFWFTLTDTSKTGPGNLSHRQTSMCRDLAVFSILLANPQSLLKRQSSKTEVGLS